MGDCFSISFLNGVYNAVRLTAWGNVGVKYLMPNVTALNPPLSVHSA